MWREVCIRYTRTRHANLFGHAGLKPATDADVKGGTLGFTGRVITSHISLGQFREPTAVGGDDKIASASPTRGVTDTRADSF